MGLLMETLHRTGQADPTALLDLPDGWLDLHLAHTRNHLVGRYDPVMHTSSGRSSSPGTLHRTRLHQQIAAHHHARRNGPTPSDVEGARWVLEHGDAMPAAARQAALATLAAAGRL